MTPSPPVLPWMNEVKVLYFMTNYCQKLMLTLRNEVKVVSRKLKEDTCTNEYFVWGMFCQLRLIGLLMLNVP